MTTWCSPYAAMLSVLIHTAALPFMLRHDNIQPYSSGETLLHLACRHRCSYCALLTAQLSGQCPVCCIVAMPSPIFPNEVEGISMLPLYTAAFGLSVVSLWRQRQFSHHSVWVNTSKGVSNTKAIIPGEACKICQGSRKVTCCNCGGVGRTNCRDQAVLPSGVSPRWCYVCRGSGRSVCPRCLGTGVKPKAVGFRLPNEP